MQAQGITVETEIVHSARAAFEAGRRLGVELATVVEDGADAFLLDLGADAPYGSLPGQASDADWDWFLSH